MPLPTNYVTGQVVAATDMNTIGTTVNALLNSLQRSLVTISTPTTLGTLAYTEYVVLISSGTTAIMPSAVGNTSTYTLKNVSTTLTASITTTSTETIDGASSATLGPLSSIDLISNGSNWNVILGGGSSSGSTVVSNEVPTGTMNGSNTVFTLSATYHPGSTQVYFNGLRLKLTLDYTETGGNTTITLAIAPVTGDTIVVDYRI